MTKKSEPFHWSKKCDLAFEEIKKLLLNSEILTTFKNNHKIILECYASPTGVGAVLLQVENGQERPIAFASKKLSKEECIYSQLDREALSIIFGLTKFKIYLLCREFELTPYVFFESYLTPML